MRPRPSRAKKNGPGETTEVWTSPKGVATKPGGARGKSTAQQQRHSWSGVSKIGGQDPRAREPEDPERGREELETRRSGLPLDGVDGYRSRFAAGPSR